MDTRHAIPSRHDFIKNPERDHSLSLEAMQFLALWATEHALFSGCTCKPEVLQAPPFHDSKMPSPFSAFRKPCHTESPSTGCDSVPCIFRSKAVESLYGEPAYSVTVPLRSTSGSGSSFPRQEKTLSRSRYGENPTLDRAFGGFGRGPLHRNFGMQIGGKL